MSRPQSNCAAAEMVMISDADLDAVSAIEQRAYEFPWTTGNLRDSMQAGHVFAGLRQSGRLLAYAVLMPVLDEAHLLNLTVAPEDQGQGWGGEMLRVAMALAVSRMGMRSMLLEVRPSNTAGLALYRRHGFLQIGRRRAYYPARDGREDALVLQRSLP